MGITRFLPEGARPARPVPSDAEIAAAKPLDPVQQAVIETRVDQALQKEVKRINRMSKLKALGEHVREGVTSLEQDAEKLATRMDSLKARGAAAFGKLHEELDAYEAAVNEAEQSLAQASNGGPPLGNS